MLLQKRGPLYLMELAELLQDNFSMMEGGKWLFDARNQYYICHGATFAGKLRVIIGSRLRLAGRYSAGADIYIFKLATQSILTVGH